MTTIPQPLTRFLLPLDIPPSCERMAWLMGTLTAALGARIENITLLHVMAGRYLSSHMENVDVRTRHVVNSELFRKLKEQHVASDIAPRLDEVKNLLVQTGVRTPVAVRIEDGDPVERISAIAAEGYSTIVMERRGLSHLQGIIVGSVAAGLLHRGLTASVYLTGKCGQGTVCPAACCLIPVDGSRHSMEAVREAGLLASHCTAVVREVVLVHVVDLARYAEENGGAVVPAEEVVEEAVAALRQAGVAEEIVTRVVRAGNPGDVISEEIDRRPCCMIIMGRRGRNMMSGLFMGSVSRKIIHRHPDNVVALVSAKG
ncbi:MAG: universal stress protein [Thermodesulfobacteriota bacterium]